MITRGYYMQSLEDTRETAPVLTSDMGGKTVLVLIHSLFLPVRADCGFRLSMYPHKYGRS